MNRTYSHQVSYPTAPACYSLSLNSGWSVINVFAAKYLLYFKSSCPFEICTIVAKRKKKGTSDNFTSKAPTGFSNDFFVHASVSGLVQAIGYNSKSQWEYTFSGGLTHWRSDT